MYKIFYSWLFWFMLGHWVLLLGVLIFSLKYLIRPFREIKPIYWILLILIFLASFYLNNSSYWFNYHTDGYVYEESARYWLKTGEFVKTCALGNVDDCKLYQQVLFLPGHPFLIASADLIFGYQSLNGAIVTGVLSSLTIIAIFLLIYLLFKSEIFGLFASLIYTFIPIAVIESRSPIPRPVASLFIVLTLIFFLIALQYKKISLWILTVLTLSFAIYIRQENYILLPFLAIFFLIFEYPKIWKAVKKSLIIFSVCCVLFFLFQIPALHWLIFDNPFHSYSADRGPFGIFFGNIFILAPAILEQFFNGSIAGPLNHYNIFVSGLFLAGLISAIFLVIFKKGNRREYLFILGLFLLYFLFTAAVAPNVEIRNGRLATTDYLRRTILLNFIYSILAALPIYWFVNLAERFFPKIKQLFSWLVLGFVSLFLIVAFPLPYKISLFRDARTERPHPDYYSAISQTPNGCLIFGSNFMIYTSDYFPENKRRLADPDMVWKTTENLFLSEMRKSYCLIYFEDYRCKLCSSLGYHGSCYPCQFIEKYFNKKFLFQQGQLTAFELKSIK